jgi:hypothetical protein
MGSSSPPDFRRFTREDMVEARAEDIAMRPRSALSSIQD